MRTAGKVVVVTGAAGGQGAAEAAALAREGATVIGLDVKEPLEPADGVVYRTFDVASEAAWADLRGWLGSEYGAIHGLVNNAGITHRGRLGEITRADLDRVLAVNVAGPLFGIQELAPLMTAGGSIVNVASIAAVTGHFPPAYTASKWALRGLSRVASMELGRDNIRVNTILPGVIVTPMAADAPEAFTRLVVGEIPLGRRGTAEDVAPLVVFLISDESAWISGAEISVDGGQAAHGGMKQLADAVREAT
ncbi:MAG TPA: SDR family oxidoreductase [Solirubrobacter sp.]|nr:SDR family oxidoreductase [Solirubrobacter sp.]